MSGTLDAMRAARYRTVEAGRTPGGAVHVVTPGGGSRALCGRFVTRRTDRDGPVCAICRERLHARSFNPFTIDPDDEP